MPNHREPPLLIHLLKTGFKSATFAYAWQREAVLLEESWEKRCKAPRGESERGCKVLCKEKAKQRNEWENKWITDRMWVSASRKISLWLPRQREVPVGSAPDIPNYVCVCVRVRLRLLICKRESRSLWASVEDDLIPFDFGCYVCISYLLVVQALPLHHSSGLLV